MFETPSTVFTPNFSFINLSACKVFIAWFCSPPTVKVRQSIIKFSFLIPIFVALFIIFSAIRTLSSTLFGTPFLSIVSPKSIAPYFFAIGKILSKTSSSPLTEFIMTLPFA